MRTSCSPGASSSGSRGVTPVTAELLAGTHRVELRLPGYKPHRSSITVIAGQPQTPPEVRLDLLDGRLNLRSEPTGATVTVDGTFRGQTPLELMLVPGQPHSIEASRAGHEPASQRIRVESGETRDLILSLEPRLGEVEILARPADVELYVDGEHRGSANQTLRLVAAPHEIELRKEGYEAYQTTVTPRPGYTQSIDVTLKTAEQIKEEATPRVIRTGEGHELVLIDGGRFLMGAPRREPGRRANETHREVELTRPYYLGGREVSNRQFRRFKSEHLSGTAGEFSLEFDHHPAVRVTWEKAALYCNWLSAQESLPPAYQRIGGRVVATRPLTTGYRLPTEAEWAWAARHAGGGAPSKYPWGNSLPVAPGSGNYADVTARDLLSSWLEDYDDGFPVTSPVDSFSPNPLGLWNLGGNVAEWVHDLYTIYPSRGGELERDPSGPTDGDLHVIRGSSWMDASVSDLRLTYRDYGKKPRPDVGFRIARYLE